MHIARTRRPLRGSMAADRCLTFFVLTGAAGFWIGTGYATGTAARMAARFVTRLLFWSLLSMGQPSLQRQRDRRRLRQVGINKMKADMLPDSSRKNR